MPTSLETLRLMAKQEADMENSSFVDPDELNRKLQDGYRELYDILTGKNQDYYLDDPTEFTLSGTDSTDLPTDFFKLVGVDAYIGGRWKALDPFNWNERNDSGAGSRGRRRRSKLRHRIVGTKLKIVPSDSCDGTYRLWYYPTCPDLVDVGELDVHAENWREYIVVCGAIYCLEKEESDTSGKVLKKAQLEKRIREAAADRDVGHSARIQDVRSGDDYYEDEF